MRVITCPKHHEVLLSCVKTSQNALHFATSTKISLIDLPDASLVAAMSVSGGLYQTIKAIGVVLP